MDTIPLYRTCPSCGKLLPPQPGDLQIPACSDCLGNGNNPGLIDAWRTHLLELQQAEKQKKSRQNRLPKTAATVLLAICFVGLASYLTHSYLQKRQADLLISLSEPDTVSVTEIAPHAKPADSSKQSK